MNHSQIEKNSMYKKMLLFFANPLYSIIWVSFKRLVDEIANFVRLNENLTTYAQQHQADTKGITKAKNEAFMAMVAVLVNKAQRAFVWALDLADEKLQYVFDIQKSDFTGMAEIKAYNKVKIVRDMLSQHIASMAGVQLADTDLAEVDAAISAYESTMGTTGSAQAHKTSGTKGLEEQIGPIDSSLDIIDKLMVSTYSESHSDLVTEYLQNRNVDKLPVHHSGISVYITDSATGTGLEGANLAINGKSAVSDIEGLAEIIKMKPGTYNVTISCEGYITQTIRIVIERGKIGELDVEMVKA